ncbi:MAG: hypothetical protein JEZ07_04145 [Phycisphaerae bacterium]|nr:hypothetical protein [Phycisphaerae bacterium]
MILVTIIKDYIKTVAFYVGAIKDKYSVDNIMLAYHQKQMPKNGILPDGSSFSLHGIGCCIELDDEHYFDFDFGPAPECRFDAFNLWFIQKYVENGKLEIPDKWKVCDVEQEFSQLIDKGIIECNDRQYGGGLYYFTCVLQPKNSNTPMG